MSNKSQLFADRTVIDEVAKLKLPDPEGVMINHGAALAIRGAISLSEIHDVDAAISYENMKALRLRVGWAVVRKTVAYGANQKPIQLIVTQDDQERYDFHRWDFSTVRYKNTGRGRIGIAQMQQDGTQDPETGIWVASLEHVIETMTDTGREKDERRLELLRTSSRKP